MSYAVRWRENAGPLVAGGLSLTEGGLELKGTSAQRKLGYGDVSGLYLERSPGPVLVLVTGRGDRLVIGSLEGLGVLHELADRVAAARGEAAA
jgi:hypothetical protein